MKRHVFILLILLFASCNTVDKRNNDTNDTSTGTDEPRFEELYRYGEYGPPDVIFDTIVNNYQLWVQSVFLGGIEDCSSFIQDFVDIEDTVFKELPFISIRLVEPDTSYAYAHNWKTVYVKAYDSTDTAQSPVFFRGIYEFRFAQGKVRFKKRFEIGCGNAYNVCLARKKSTTVQTYRNYR